jgi:hypothetical protein
MARRDTIAVNFREPKQTNTIASLDPLVEEAQTILPTPTSPPQPIPIETDQGTEAFEIPIQEKDSMETET